ncbi:hypothetical protein GYMLUDRAFT_61298 [Collybiopsis luxurians FD-317 M1]|uniref:Uncharacterized protein n=1 Tax=Collybiopsis luxurians FD-317 M1 TaxID=944289 RepID=A0A0D0CH77_9AGAR|nr:hypothetical protein GYMLUDRAFT_61298 [Collybiopsis luxurians FD-317 M1]
MRYFLLLYLLSLSLGRAFGIYFDDVPFTATAGSVATATVYFERSDPSMFILVLDVKEFEGSTASPAVIETLSQPKPTETRILFTFVPETRGFFGSQAQLEDNYLAWSHRIEILEADGGTSSLMIATSTSHSASSETSTSSNEGGTTHNSYRSSIIGGIIGGLVAIFVIVLSLLFWIRWRKSQIHIFQNDARTTNGAVSLFADVEVSRKDGPVEEAESQAGARLIRTSDSENNPENLQEASSLGVNSTGEAFRRHSYQLMPPVSQPLSTVPQRAAVIPQLEQTESMAQDESIMNELGPNEDQNSGAGTIEHTGDLRRPITRGSSLNAITLRHTDSGFRVSMRGVGRGVIELPPEYSSN